MEKNLQKAKNCARRKVAHLESCASSLRKLGRKKPKTKPPVWEWREGVHANERVLPRGRPNLGNRLRAEDGELITISGYLANVRSKRGELVESVDGDRGKGPCGEEGPNWKG